MNSTEIINAFVKRVVETTEEFEFEMLMKDLGDLRCYVEDVDNRENSDYRTIVEKFDENFKFNPEYFRFELAFQLNDELWRNKHSLFETYKICYSIKLLGDYNTIGTCRNNVENIKFVEYLFEEASLSNGISFFRAIKMLKRNPFKKDKK